MIMLCMSVFCSVSLGPCLFGGICDMYFLLLWPPPPQCIVSLEGGKLVCKTGKFTHVQELKGGEMVEVQYILPELTHIH